MDISKCNNIKCQLKESCFRYTCPASIYQSFFMPEFTGKYCEYFIDREEYDGRK